MCVFNHFHIHYLVIFCTLFILFTSIAINSANEEKRANKKVYRKKHTHTWNRKDEVIEGTDRQKHTDSRHTSAAYELI